MKLTILFASLAPAMGFLPPAYLYVEGHEACLGTKQVGSYQQLCNPGHRLEGCSAEAYHELFEVLSDFAGEDKSC